MRDVRYKKQIERKTELTVAQEKTRARLVYEEGPRLQSCMEDAIRDWIFTEK